MPGVTLIACGRCAVPLVIEHAPRHSPSPRLRSLLRPRWPGHAGTKLPGRPRPGPVAALFLDPYSLHMITSGIGDAAHSGAIALLAGTALVAGVVAHSAHKQATSPCPAYARLGLTGHEVPALAALGPEAVLRIVCDQAVPVRPGIPLPPVPAVAVPPPAAPAGPQPPPVGETRRPPRISAAEWIANWAERGGRRDAPPPAAPTALGVVGEAPGRDVLVAMQDMPADAPVLTGGVSEAVEPVQQAALAPPPQEERVDEADPGAQVRVGAGLCQA